MPSRFESLSMVALEAWALGRPVIANARCDVLLGQCIRSNAGLFYEDSVEFAAVLDRILADERTAHTLGRNGRAEKGAVVRPGGAYTWGAASMRDVSRP